MYARVNPCEHSQVSENPLYVKNVVAENMRSYSYVTPEALHNTVYPESEDVGTLTLHVQLCTLA